MQKLIIAAVGVLFLIPSALPAMGRGDYKRSGSAKVASEVPTAESAGAEESDSGDALVSGVKEEPMIRVLTGGRKNSITTLPLETYLAGVIGNEMSRRWPKEALKAQAVAARSYALARIKHSRQNGRKYDVVPTQGDQVFKMRDIGNEYLASIVTETRGQVLVKGDKIVTAYYSSTCGGKMRAPKDAGLNQYCPIPGKGRDAYCNKSPFRNWQIKSTLADMEKLLQRKGYKVSGLKEIEVGSRDESDYVKTVTIKDSKRKWTMKGGEFRKLMGSMKLKSLLFRVDTHDNGTIHIAGNGFGHGVGMCQYGAHHMAKKSKGYKAILSKYYPGVKVAKMY